MRYEFYVYSYLRKDAESLRSESQMKKQINKGALL